MKSYPRALVLSSLFLGALGLGGCAAGNGAAGLLLLAMGAAAALAGCGDTAEKRDVGSSKYPCCVNGQATECNCDAGFSSCNYAVYVIADSGMCMYPPSPYRLDAAPDVVQDAAGPDAPANAPVDLGVDMSVDVARDAGGFSYQCCNQGRLETCYCPPATACNYGVVVNCGDGTCYERLLPNVDPDGGACLTRDGGGQ